MNRSQNFTSWGFCKLFRFFIKGAALTYTRKNEHQKLKSNERVKAIQEEENKTKRSDIKIEWNFNLGKLD